MKKVVMSLALLFSASCFAFPEFEAVHCDGSFFGYPLFIEYYRDTHELTIMIAGEQGTGPVNEEGNRIFSTPEYNEDGVLEAYEVVSNSSDWNAAFNAYENNQLAWSIPLSCRSMTQFSSHTGSGSAIHLLSKLAKKGQQ